MTEEFPRPIHFVAANLALLVGGIHVVLGVYNWTRWLLAGFLLPRDLRWPLFVVSSILLVIGSLAAIRNWTDRRLLYAGGIALSLGYAVAYFGWHLTGHRPLVFLGRGAPHDGPLVPFLVDHLFAGPLEFLTISLELTLALVLAYLLVAER